MADTKRAAAKASAKAPSKRAAAWPAVKEPTLRQLAASEEARARNNQRPPPLPFEARMTEGGSLQVSGNLSDQDVAWNRLQDVCGTASDAWIDAIVSGLVNAKGGKADDSSPESLLQGLAFLNGVGPRDEVEAALASQMYAVHVATMGLSRRMAAAEQRDQLRDYGNLLVKTARTFAAQVEALSKLRSGGKQQVEVRYIYVDARGGQNVIGSEIHSEGGAGGDGSENRRQPHAPAAFSGLPFAPGAPMWSQEQGGVALPGAGDATEAPMQAPRGEEPRRAARKGERSV